MRRVPHQLRTAVHGRRASLTYWRPAATNFHNGDPRIVEVVRQASGVEHRNAPYAPVFEIAVWGFRGNRGIQMEAIYPYTLVPAQ